MEQQVRERAYQIWIEAGMAPGFERDHWIAAERDIVANLIAGPTVSKRPTASKAKPVVSKAAGAQSTATKAAKTATASTRAAKAPEAKLAAVKAKTSKSAKAAMSGRAR